MTPTGTPSSIRLTFMFTATAVYRLSNPYASFESTSVSRSLKLTSGSGRVASTRIIPNTCIDVVVFVEFDDDGVTDWRTTFASSY